MCRFLTGHLFVRRPDAVRFAGALRPALAARGVPSWIYVDYAEVDVKPENLNPACSGRSC